MSIEALEERVIEWAKDRGIFEQSTPLTRYRKMAEEFEELTDELFPPDGGAENLDAIKMEAGDVLVTLINLLHPYGLNLETCLSAAYEKIKDRTGEMRNGTYVKTEDL